MMVKAVLEEECVGPGLRRSPLAVVPLGQCLYLFAQPTMPKYSYFCHPLLDHIVIFSLGHTSPLKKTKGFSFFVVLSFCYNL